MRWLLCLCCLVAASSSPVESADAVGALLAAEGQLQKELSTAMQLDRDEEDIKFEGLDFESYDYIGRAQEMQYSCFPTTLGNIMRACPKFSDPPSRGEILSKIKGIVGADHDFNSRGVSNQYTQRILTAFQMEFECESGGYGRPALTKTELWERLQVDVIQDHKAVYLGRFDSESSANKRSGHAIMAVPREFLGRKGKEAVGDSPIGVVDPYLMGFSGQSFEHWFYGMTGREIDEETWKKLDLKKDVVPNHIKAVKTSVSIISSSIFEWQPKKPSKPVSWEEFLEYSVYKEGGYVYQYCSIECAV